MFDKVKAQNHLSKLLKQYKIKVIGYSTTSCGYARWRSREIKIPRPTNTDRFCVCMHEIKHIIDGDKGKRFEQEFDCDMYALLQAKMMAFGIKEWEKRMRWHSLSRIAMAHNRGYDISNLRSDIKSFFKEVNWSKWRGSRVFVHSVDKSEFGYSMDFSPMMSSHQVNESLEKIGLKLAKSDRDDSTNGKWIVHKDDNQNSCMDFVNLSEVVTYFELRA